jgi:hypothetical protein
MITYTGTAEFLSETHEINGFIDDIISCPRKISWHWPSFYLLYVDVDRLAMALMRTEHLLRSPRPDSPMHTSIEELVEDTNAILCEVGNRQKAIFRWFYRMSRNITYSAEVTALHARLDAHVHPKSGWYQEFFAQYDAGIVSVDGRTLSRIVLPILTAPPYERIDEFTASCMLRRQTFDFASPEERIELANATKQASVNLGQIAARMQAYLVEYCKLEDLLHPCSA